MEVLSIILFILGIVLAGTGIAISFDDFIIGFTFLVAGTFAVVAGFHIDNTYQNDQVTNGTRQMLTDLRTQGWDINKSDIHYDKEKVDIGCVSLDVEKLANRYKIVIPRPDKDGGGFLVLKPNVQPKFDAACSNGGVK